MLTANIDHLNALSIPSEPQKVKPSYTFDMDTIGARMRAAREAVGLSQDDAAVDLGVSKGSLSAWENDKHFPQLETFMALCRIYHASADHLLFQSGSVREARAAYDVDVERLHAVIARMGIAKRKAFLALFAKD